MSLHSQQTANHRLENWSFANLTTRLANGPYIANDISKIAYQQDDKSYWRLVLITLAGGIGPLYTPTWVPISTTKFDPNRIVNLYNVTGLTGGGVNKLDGISVTGFTFGQKVVVTIDDADSFFTYQSGAPDAVKGDVAATDGNRWRLTGGSGA